ncbi:MAG: ribose-phosphate pyrophosphokinase [Planctomycetota bacterium]
MRELKIFSGRANTDLTARICRHLHLDPAAVTLGQFPDGENYCKLDEDVRGRDVFLVQPTCPPGNDNLVELLIMIDSCKRASAARVTPVIPYFGYARQDRKDEGRVPITAKLVANMIARAGADRVLTMDLHAAQIQGFFDVPVDHLYAAPVLNEHFIKSGISGEDIVVVSPDEGSIKRALGHNKRLGGELAIINKQRTSSTEVKQKTIIGGPIEGKITLMFDDMISTAGSICGAARLVREHGAKEIHVATTHAVLCGPAISRLRDAPIDSLVVTDSIPIPAEKRLPNMVELSVAPLLAEAIKRIHHDQSISELFRER